MALWIIMAIKVAINGFGRIGRAILRALFETGRQQVMRVVAVNELADPAVMAHLLEYDTTHGRFRLPIELRGRILMVAGVPIPLLSEPAPANIPWRDLGVDLVMECSGIHKTRAAGESHLAAGARKVLFANPADDAVDAVVVYGVNHHIIRPEHTVVSNASCTTNCVIPVIDTLDRAFGVERGLITSIHAAMNDQNVLDSYHHNMRLCRAAWPSIVPVDTGLGRGVGRILPKFKGKFEAISVRVPTLNVSALDLSVELKKNVTTSEVNQSLKAAAAWALRGILEYSDRPLVSVDYNHNPHSSIVDASQTRVIDGTMVKLLTWCDNEWGFANRMLDTALAMHTTCEGEVTQS